MRVALSIILLLTLLMVFSTTDTGGQPAVACIASNCTVSVERTMATNDWGVTIMNDTVKLNATTPVTFITLGIPSSVAERLRYIAAEDSQGTALQVSKLEETVGYRPFSVDFLSSRSGSYAFSVTGVFSGLLSLDPATSRYTFSFSPFPVTDGSFNVTKADVVVSTKGWPSPVVSGVHGTQSGDSFRAGAAPLNALNNTVAKMNFSASASSQFDLEVAAARSITIFKTGPMEVSDSYNITNRGKDVQNLLFTLPRGVSGIFASDIVGRLDETKIVTIADPSNGATNVTITTRFGTVKNNGSASLTLTYDLSSDVYVSTSSIGKYTLNFQVFNNIKFFQTVLETKIIMPTGFRLNTLTGQTPIVSGSKTTLRVASASPLSKLDFTMNYQLDPFWSGLDPLSWAGLVEGALLAVAIVIGAGSKVVATGFAPADLIGRFVELYDEKSALRFETEKMEEDLERGAINRHDFRRRRRVIDLRTAEIDRLLTPAKERLAAGQSRYQDLIRRIERAEAELQVAKNSLTDLRSQYRSGRIARELHESLLADVSRRKQRAQQTIDNIMIGLREEAR